MLAVTAAGAVPPTVHEKVHHWIVLKYFKNHTLNCNENLYSDSKKVTMLRMCVIKVVELL
jgi:hypothetical protein